MSEAGRKIIDGLKDAVAGNFSAVTIEGQRWVRSDEIDRLTAERDELARAVRDFVAAWDWWQVDPVDRCQPDTIDMRNALPPRSALSHGSSNNG